MKFVAQIADGLVVNIIAVTRETEYATIQFLEKAGFTVSKDKESEIGDEWNGKKVKKAKDKKPKVKNP